MTPHETLKWYVRRYVEDEDMYRHVCMIVDSFDDRRPTEEIEKDPFGKRGIGLGSQIS